MLTVREGRAACVAVALVAIVFAAGCGSSDTKSGTSTASTTATSASAGYRAAVNKLFNAVVAARGDYQAAHGDAALRDSAVALVLADRAGLRTLAGLKVPASAKALQGQLTSALKTQAAALEALLADSKINTAKLGDAVLLSNDAESLVSQINTLP